MTNRKNPVKRLRQCGKSRGIPNFIECFDEKLDELKKAIIQKRGRPYRKGKNRWIGPSYVLQEMTFMQYRRARKTFLSYVPHRRVMRLDAFDLRFVSSLAYHIQRLGEDNRPIRYTRLMATMSYYTAVFNYACNKHQVSYDSGFKLWEYEFKRYGWAVPEKEPMGLSVELVMQRMGHMPMRDKPAMADMPFPYAILKN